MSRLALSFLGPPRVALDSATVEFPRHKVLALLAYLAVTGRHHSRDSLAELFHGDQDREHARASLRQTLSFLGRAVGREHLEADRHGARLQPGKGLWVDVSEYRRILENGGGRDPSSPLPADPDRLARAARLIRGEFLAGFYLKGCPGFEDWQLQEQETLRREQTRLLQRLVEIHHALGQHEQAIDYAERWLTLDPAEEGFRYLMLSYASQGRWAWARRQYEKCREVLRRDLGVEPEARTTELYQQIRARRLPEESGATHGSPGATFVPNNLPSQLSPLVGRKQELMEIAALLQRGSVSILTLTGPGGTGKTRLALQAAAALADRFAHGAFFVDLSSLRDPARVIPFIAAALRVREGMGNSRPLEKVLEDYLQQRRVLLVLDNFEQVRSSAPGVARLLARCPGVKTLVTSREPLGLREEMLFHVPPLAVPRPRASLLPEVECDSALLFAERAREVRTDFAVTDQNAPAVAAICRQLDGLPLAIELAASRLDVLSVGELAKRLSQRLSLLARRPGDGPPRHQTLRRMLDWSHDLLDDGEKALFGRLSLFAGGCTVEAAEYLCSDGTDMSRSAVLDGLASLLTKNLVIREETGGFTRFRMLETIGAYALERLEGRGEAPELRGRHAAFYLCLAEDAGARLHGPGQMGWLDCLERDHDNLRAAMARLLGERDAERALRLGAALDWFWYRSGSLREGKEWLTEALRLPGAPAPARAAALRTLGKVLYFHGDWSPARTALAESRELYHGLGMLLEESHALGFQGAVERSLGEIPLSVEHCASAIQAARAAGNHWHVAYCLLLAYATIGGKWTGRPPVAELHEALELFRAAGDLWGMAHTLDGLGDLHRELGQPADAATYYQQALAGFERLRDRWMVAWAQAGLGSVLAMSGDLPQAMSCYGKALDLFDVLGDRTNAVVTLGRLGMLARRREDHPRAARLLAGFEGLRQGLAGSLGPRHFDQETETALEAYRDQFRSEWPAWREMGLHQAVEEGFADQPRPTSPGRSG